MLQHFADRLRDSVRSDDVVARVGGDEFLLCMGCSVDPRPLVERIHRSLEGEFEGFPLSVSMGVATTDGGDVALYHKKRDGRGGYVFYDDLSDQERAFSLDEPCTALSGIDRNDSDQ